MKKCSSSSSNNSIYLFCFAVTHRNPHSQLLRLHQTTATSKSITVSIPACHAGDPGSIPGGEGIGSLFYCADLFLVRPVEKLFDPFYELYALYSPVISLFFPFFPS